MECDEEMYPAVRPKRQTCRPTRLQDFEVDYGGYSERNQIQRGPPTLTTERGVLPAWEDLESVTPFHIAQPHHMGRRNMRSLSLPQAHLPREIWKVPASQPPLRLASVQAGIIHPTLDPTNHPTAASGTTAGVRPPNRPMLSLAPEQVYRGPNLLFQSLFNLIPVNSRDSA
ncbi:hypothetical protein SRHO_G00059160 [Serrasalmus rhombeus]